MTDKSNIGKALLVVGAGIAALAGIAIASAKKPEPRKSYINVTSTPPGATILLNNIFVGITPISNYEVSPGSYRIYLNLDGYEPAGEDFTITEGETKEFHSDLAQIVNPSFINISSVPLGATVLLDNIDIGTTPISNYEIHSGSHAININLAGYEPVQEYFTITEGETKNFNYALVWIPIPAYINVYSIPAGATILLDNVNIGVTPINNFKVSPGFHRIDASLTGYESVGEDFTISEGKTINFSYDLFPIARPAYINVTSTPSGATVLLNNVNIGITPISNYEASLGSNRLDISLAGYEPVQEYFTITEGQTRNFNYTLNPIVLPAYINVTSTPSGATVLLDGVNIGLTPISNYEVSVGFHRIDINLAGYEPAGEDFTIAKGQTKNFNYTLNPIVLPAYINVTSTPSGATVLLDGVNIGVTPISNYQVVP